MEMEAFLAFLEHVHAMLTNTYHNTPIVLMASPQWTRHNCETIARYIFEKTRTPALCLLHSGIATQYGLKSPNMTVVDIGFEKVDVTAIHDGRVVNHQDLGSPNPDKVISGGEVFTQNLLSKLRKQGFTYDMAEQLKKSSICEVLPYSAGAKELMDLPTVAPADVVSSKQSQGTDMDLLKPTDRPPGQRMDGVETDGADKNGDEDGVLDVAGIVNSGQTREFLARKEKEKEKEKEQQQKEQQKEKGKRGPKAKGEEPTKVVRLINSQKGHNTFHYEEIIQEEIKPDPPKEIKPVELPKEQIEPKEPPKETTENQGQPQEPQESKEPISAPAIPSTEPTEKKEGEETADKPSLEQPKPSETERANVGEEAPKPSEPVPTTTTTTDVEKKTEVDESNALPFKSEPPVITTDPPERRAKRVRRDVEVGIERFTFAERAEIDRIAHTIYRTVQGIEDMYMRPPCWDNLVFVGNGARLRGLKDNILQTLNARYLVSPSTATMFTSELPSNVATPTGTGSQTPTGSFTGAPHQLSTSGVNPLLQAATTASSLGIGQQQGAPGSVATPGGGGSEAAGPTATHHFHSQTPTSIKTVTIPTYLGEWTKNGFEEAMFLGAQVAARIAFCLHSNMDAQGIEAQRLMSLSRVDYK